MTFTVVVFSLILVLLAERTSYQKCHGTQTGSWLIQVAWSAPHGNTFNAMKSG